MADQQQQDKIEALQRRLEMRRFYLKRLEDASGVSGVGYVAEGTQLSDGTCVLRWLSATSCIAIYHSHVELIHIHGHEGRTVIEWVDEEEPPTPEENGKSVKQKNSSKTKNKKKS